MVCFMCVFRWSVRRTCGFDGAFRWTGGCRYQTAPQVLRPPPKKQTIKQSSRFAREVPPISSRLLALVFETSDSRSSTCARVAAIPTSTAPCARLHFFVIFYFPCKMALAYVEGWGLIGHQDVVLGDLYPSLKNIAWLPREVFVSGFIGDPVCWRPVGWPRKVNLCTCRHALLGDSSASKRIWPCSDFDIGDKYWRGLILNETRKRSP